MNIEYWAWLGTLNLLILTFQDYKNNMTIDDRKNFFMAGVTISLISHVNASFSYIFFLIVFTILIKLFLEKKAGFASGDTSAFQWIFLGFGLLGLKYLISFLIFFTIGTSLYFTLKLIIEKILKLQNKPFPFFGVILILYVFSCFVLGLF